MHMLNEATPPSVHVLSSRFYELLSGDRGRFDYTRVEGWCSRAKLDVFELETLIAPINIYNYHWTLIVVKPQERKVSYFDSMTEGPDSGYYYIKCMLMFLELDAKRLGKRFDR